VLATARGNFWPCWRELRVSYELTLIIDVARQDGQRPMKTGCQCFKVIGFTHGEKTDWRKGISSKKGDFLFC
jgi:hypothetical protein